MTFIYILQFWGTIIAMSGALTAFLVGAVYADLWASQRRSQKYYAERQKEFLDTPTDDSEREIIEDPFEETYDDEESQSGNTE